MIEQLAAAPSATSTSSLGVLARRLAHALESKEVELAALRRRIAELEKARERDEQLRRLGEAQASLAHQMRTPLTVAGLHLDQLVIELGESTARSRVQKVQTSLYAVERQIRNALVFVTGRLGERVVFEAASLIDTLRDNLAPLEGVHPIRWHTGTLDAVAIDGDRSVLAGAIVNLVENAVAVGGSKVTVDLEVRTAADRLEISVSDNGPGMSRELLGRVRVPFVSERAGGTGLGLTIAERVVAAHGGRLDIESAPDEGTRIRISLPIVSVPSRASAYEGVCGLPNGSHARASRC
jgi:two-component system sensor histidine kinase FlrB